MSANHYKTLGVSKNATDDEIRRAYRTLARRYHPDVNPGVLSSERFKIIAQAYAILGDLEKRKAYDLAISQNEARYKEAFDVYQKNQAKQEQKSAKQRYYEAQRADYEKLKNLTKKKAKSGLNLTNKLTNILRSSLDFKLPKNKPKKFAVQIKDVTLNLESAIKGCKKNIDLDESGSRKLKVSIPPGSFSGSLIKVRETSTNKNFILNINVKKQNNLSFEKKGVVLDVPISVSEALNGANFKVPTCKEEVLINIDKNTKSGTELRIKGKGPTIKNNKTLDFYVRLNIELPENENNAELIEAGNKFDKFYESNIREKLPKNISFE